MESELGLMETMNVFITQGGVAGKLIFLTAGVLAFFGSERLYYLFVKLSFSSQKALDQIRECVLNRKYTDAVQICSTNQRVPELNVIKHGLLAVENGREAMKSALGGAILETSRKCEKHISYIALIASAATLMGLLGTITGLIKTFSAIADTDPTEKAKLLGEGISEAMYSTVFGLSVGIIAMVVHTLCISKTDKIVGTAQDVGLKLITWVEQSERSKNIG